MMIGKNGACQIIEVKTASFALIALAMGLSVILASFNHFLALTPRAAYATTPSNLANNAVTFGMAHV